MVKENLLVKPGEIDPLSIGQLEGFTHQATLIFLNEKLNIDTIANGLMEPMQKHRDISYGITALPVSGLMVRILGQKAEQLFGVIKQLVLTLNASLLNAEKPNVYV